MHQTEPPITVGLLFAEALAAPEVAWSLRDAGFRVLVITRCRSKPPVVRIRGVRSAKIHPPEFSLSRCRRELVSLLTDASVDLLMPLDDVALAVTEGIELPCALVGATGDQRRLALDKSLQLDAAKHAGLHVPETTLWRRGDDTIWTGEFPVVVKPADAVTIEDDRVTKGASFVCADQVELDRALSGIASPQPYLLQSHVVGRGHGVFGIACADGVTVWSGHVRVRMMNPIGSGSSACAPATVSDELRQACERFLADTRWRGLFMIELLVSEDGVPWFVELNGRTWGSMALARRQGLEYPAWAVKATLEEAYHPTAPSEQVEVGLCRHLGYELLHLAFVLRGPRTAAPVIWPTFTQASQAVLRVHRSHRWYNWQRREWGVFVYDLLWTLRCAATRRRD